MYDFYKNPPETKQDLRDYLTSWLQNVDDVTPLVIRDETFIQEKGFKRVFHSHCVFRSLATNEYVWWVYEEYDLENFPRKRFPTYESMLESVIDEYYVAWKLQG
jgi:hypothetical protein